MTTIGIESTKEKHITGHRLSKLTPELITKMADIMAQGHYFITAINACGIGKTIAYEWINRGETDRDNRVESLYLDLVNALKNAEAKSEQALLSVVKDKAINGKEWLPAMTILERRHPERWGRKDRSTLVVEETKQIIITTVEVVKDYGREQIVEGEAKEIPEGGKEG